VADPYELDLERPDGHGLARLDRLEPRGIFQPELDELLPDEAEGERGSVDGRLNLGEEERQAADVVFVTVSEDNPSQLFTSFEDIGKVGRPQSTTMMSPPCSRTIMFKPISPRPPSGIILISSLDCMRLIYAESSSARIVQLRGVIFSRKGAKNAKFKNCFKDIIKFLCDLCAFA
jgi:hypothetical protein